MPLKNEQASPAIDYYRGLLPLALRGLGNQIKELPWFHACCFADPFHIEMRDAHSKLRAAFSAAKAGFFHTIYLPGNR